MKNKTLWIIVAIIVLLVFLFAGNRGYKETLKQYVDASMLGNGKKIVKLIPKEYIKLAISQDYYSNKAEMINDYNISLNQYISAINDRFANNWKYKYKIIDVIKYNNDEIEAFLLVSNYGQLLSKVKAIKEVTYELKIYNNDFQTLSTEKLLLVKLGQKWYIADSYIQ